MRTEFKDNFIYRELGSGEELLQENGKGTNHLVFIISGNLEVMYGSLHPKEIAAGNMILLTPLSNYVCKAISSVEVLILEFEGLKHSCDKYIFQNLSPVFTLIKYEFQQLEIREPLWNALTLIIYYMKNSMMSEEMTWEKIRELFILIRAYYDVEDMVKLFYPLLGKNMEFRKMVIENFSRVKNAGEYASLCGYSLGVFQRKFKDVFGETVYQWMQKQKAEQIKHCLMTTDISLKELADEFDFASAAHLNKFSKVWFGMTPSELRQTYLLKKNLK